MIGINRMINITTLILTKTQIILSNMKSYEMTKKSVLCEVTNSELGGPRGLWIINSLQIRS